jgi:hypothetical protein
MGTRTLRAFGPASRPTRHRLWPAHQVRLRPGIVRPAGGAAWLSAPSAGAPPARLRALALLLMRRRTVDPVSDVVIDELAALAGKVRRLDANMHVALTDAEKSGAALVDDFDFHLVQLATELIERLLNGFLAGLRCGLHYFHLTSCLLWPHGMRRGAVRPAMALPRPGAPENPARDRTERQALIYFLFGRFLPAFANSLLRC